MRVSSAARLATASGFKADGDGDDDGNDAEQVAYWVNTPSGGIIDRDGAANDDDTRLLPRANSDGSLALEWTAPADGAKGSYTLVLRGTTSGVEQTVAFTLR